jgi:ferredoxin
MAMSAEIQRQLRVNPILCNGFGYCAEIVPELISLDDWGFPIVSSRPIEDDKLLGLSRRAVATCPRLALLIEETVRAPTGR